MIGSSLASLLATAILTVGCGLNPSINPIPVGDAGASGPTSNGEPSEQGLDLSGCTPYLTNVSPRPDYWEAKNDVSTLAFRLTLDETCPLPVTIMSIETSTMPLLTANQVLPMYWEWTSASSANVHGLAASGTQSKAILEAQLISNAEIKPNTTSTFTFTQNLAPFVGKTLGEHLDRITYRIGKTGSPMTLKGQLSDQPLIYGSERKIGSN